MRIETKRLIIRSLTLEDEQVFIEMASDGSLNEIYGDCSECHKWMKKWIEESIQLEAENNPNQAVRAFVSYFFQHYDTDILIATPAVSNKASCRTLEKAGFALVDTRIYQDMFDDKAELRNFYELKRGI